MNGSRDVSGFADVIVATKSRNHQAQWSEGLTCEGYRVHSCIEEARFEAVFLEVPKLDVIIVEAPFFAMDDLASLRQFLGRKEQDFGSLVIFPQRDRHNRQAALDAGIDMPMLAPVTAGEVVSAVRSLLKRHSNGHATASMEIGEARASWTCDPVSWRMMAPGGLGVARLTYREIEFIVRLAKQPGLPVRREEFSYLFGVSPELFDPRRLEVMVRRMRKTILAETGQELPLLTAHGVGYALGTHLQVVGSVADPAGLFPPLDQADDSESRSRDPLTKPPARPDSLLQKVAGRR
jgi:DNA-binding response OmpR family regulator